jgi:hypothetical protein
MLSPAVLAMRPRYALIAGSKSPPRLRPRLDERAKLVGAHEPVSSHVGHKNGSQVPFDSS